MALKGLDPLLSPDLLWLLAAMGHGDDLALVDGLHPAESMARATVTGKVVRLPGIAIERAARAILSVMPLDTYVPDPARCMEVVGDPTAVPEVRPLVQAEVDRAFGQPHPMRAIERFAFYEEEKKAFAVVQVGDTRPYGCFLFRMGVL